MDDTNDLVAGLKADVDQHAAANIDAPAQAPAGNDLISGLKSDVDHALGGGQPAPPKPSPKVDLSKMKYPDKVVLNESHGDANAQAPGSSATGTGQFINSTWVPLIRKNRPDLAKGKSDQDILAMRNDPDLSRQMIDAYGNENAQKLQASGVPVSDATKYGAHWFGPDNYIKIHNADPNTPVEKIIGSAAAQNNNILGQSAGAIKTLAQNRMGPDAEKPPADWGDTIEQAGENLLPSVGRAASGVYHAVTHPVDTAKTLWQIGKGLDSKINGYAGVDQDPKQKAKDEKLVDALAQSYKEKYGSIDGFKEYLAKDPAGVLMDASTVLSGGGGLAAKLPGMAGKAGELAATVGKVVNPLNPAGAVSGSVKALTGGAKTLDASGNITPKVDDMIKKVTDGTMSGKDLVDPDIKAAFAATIAKKGLSEETVKEGLLRSLGLKAPTQSVTGRAVPASAKDVTTAAIEHNNNTLDSHASQLGGTPSTSDLGAALDQAHTASFNRASAAYDKIRAMPGSFGATMPEMPQLGTAIKNNFSKSGIPAGDFAALAQTGHTQAAAAIKLLKDRWGAGKTLMGKDFNAQEVLSMRKALNNLKASATGSDQKAVSDIISAVDSHVQDLSGRGFFFNSRGQPVQGLGQQINAANAGYRAHFNAFDQSPNPAMRSAVTQLKDKQQHINGQRMPSGDVDRYATAQSALGQQLLHPTKGANTYNQLKTALGGNSGPIDDFVKSMVLNGDTPLKNAGQLLNNPNSVVSKAFSNSPGDLSQARHIQAARDITNTKPTMGKASSLRSMLSGLALKGGSSVAGYETMGLPGLVTGPLIEHGLEKLNESRVAKNAMAGAPNTSNIFTRGLKGTAQRLTSPVGITAAHYKDEAQKVKDSIPRASGGKVDHEALVGRLINRWKAAKKATDETTKPLLNVPDAAIVRALDIAQEHI